MEGWADRGACRVRVAGPLPSAPQSASWGCTQKREVVPMGGSDRVKGPQHQPGAKQEGGSRGLLHDVGAVRRGRGTGQRGRVTGPGLAARWRAGRGRATGLGYRWPARLWPPHREGPRDLNSIL